MAGGTPPDAVPVGNAMLLRVLYQLRTGRAEWDWWLVPSHAPSGADLLAFADALHTFEAGSILPVRVGASTLRPTDSLLDVVRVSTPYIGEGALSTIVLESLRGTPAPGGTYAVPDSCCPQLRFGLTGSAHVARRFFPWSVATYRDDMDTSGGLISPEDQDTFLTFASRWLEVLSESFGVLGHEPIGRTLPRYDRPAYFLPLSGQLAIAEDWRTQARRRGPL